MGNYEQTVDENDRLTGSKHWRDMQYSDIYRVTALWLTDQTTGEILLAQRKWNKKNHPGKWGPAAAGTVEVDETYDSNIVKEIAEEIGLTGLELSKGPKLFNDDGDNRFFCQWYLSKIDRNKLQIKIQEAEVEAIKWVTKGWLLTELARHPDIFTPNMPEDFKRVGKL